MVKTMYLSHWWQSSCYLYHQCWSGHGGGHDVQYLTTSGHGVGIHTNGGKVHIIGGIHAQTSKRCMILCDKIVPPKCSDIENPYNDDDQVDGDGDGDLKVASCDFQ